MLSQPYGEKVSWCSEGTSCLSVCVHCLWPLKSAWLFPFSLQVFTCINVILSLLLSKLTLPFLKCDMLKSLNYLGVPLQDSLQQLNVSCTGKCRTAPTIFLVWSYQCWVEGQDQFPQSAGKTPPHQPPLLQWHIAGSWPTQCPPDIVITFFLTTGNKSIGFSFLFKIVQLDSLQRQMAL